MRTLAAACLLLASATPVLASPESARLRAAAIAHAYNLDYDDAARVMSAAARADPQDVAAERGLAFIPWLEITFRRGAVTVDDYLGSLTKQNVAMRQPPPDLAGRFTRHAARALSLAEAQADARPADAEALFQLGTVVGLQASYVATVEGRFLAGFRAARRAYDAHERVIEMDPSRADAGLVVGMYRYVVSVMPLPMRVLAYVAGFGGGKERGIQLVEEAASSRTESSTDARFALVLLYNREGRFGEALRTLADLRRLYPRNRILWLESGATALRAGDAAGAERVLTEGMRKTAADPRPRMLGEDAMWRLKRGSARVALGRLAEADADLRPALATAARPWVLGRVHAELGKLADLRGNRAAARVHFEKAASTCEQDNDPLGAEAARRWIDTRYDGKLR